MLLTGAILLFLSVLLVVVIGSLISLAIGALLAGAALRILHEVYVRRRMIDRRPS